MPPFLMHFLLFGSYKGERWVQDAHVAFGHHMACVDTAGLSAQSPTNSELRAVVAESQR